MNKKILFALSVCLVAVIAIGTVSAFDLGSLFGGAPEDQNVTIAGETFKIPGTFKENINITNNGTVNDYAIIKTGDYGKGYVNDTNYINIYITEYNGTELTSDLINYMNGTSKDISGVQGYMYKDENGYTYTYAKNNKVIAIQSDNEALIAPVIA